MRSAREGEEITCSTCNRSYVPVQVWKASVGTLVVWYGLLPEHDSYGVRCERSGLSEMMPPQPKTS